MPRFWLAFPLVLATTLGGCATAPSATEAPAAIPPAPDTTVSQEPGSISILAQPLASPAAADAINSRTARITVVTPRVSTLHADADHLTALTASHISSIADLKAQRLKTAGEYFGYVGEINARLQAGTTPGNPDLVALWQQAETALSALDSDATQLNVLTTQLTNDSSTQSYLLASVRAAFSLPGGIDADRDALEAVEAEVQNVATTIDAALSDSEQDLNRQGVALAIQHRNLATLANAIAIGQALGDSLGNLTEPSEAAAPEAPMSFQSVPAPVGYSASPQVASASAGPRSRRHRKSVFETPSSPAVSNYQAPAYSAAPVVPAPVAIAPAPAPARAAVTPLHPKRVATVITSSPPSGHLLITIPAESDSSTFERGLYAAVADMLDRNPSGRITVDAAAPSNGDPIKVALAASQSEQEADAVIRSLTAFGLPPGRITQTSSRAIDVQDGEVRVFGD